MISFEIGSSPARLEDERLLQGKGRYLDDLRVAGQSHAVFVRSPHAHAVVVRTDTGAAGRMPGVLAVLTHDDLARDGLQPLHPSVRGNVHTGEAFSYEPQPLLAAQRVRHVGEIVAMVVARSMAQALDAAEAVTVDYRPLDAVVDVDAATRPAAPELSARIPENVCLDHRFGDAHAVDEAFARAAHRVEMCTVNHRVITNSMEPRGAVGRYEADTGRYDLHASTQNVHVLRDEVAAALGVERHRVRLHAGDVGGGFGNRNFVYPEYPLLLWAARRTGRPVRWVATRCEGFVSDHQARDFIARAQLALDAEGRFTALRVESRGRGHQHRSGGRDARPRVC